MEPKEEVKNESPDTLGSNNNESSTKSNEVQQNSQTIDQLNEDFHNTYVNADIKQSIKEMFRDREYQFSETKGYTFSFAGLKRVLGNVHQQTLVNALDTLIEDDILMKNSVGYALKEPLVTEKKSVSKNINWDYPDYCWIARAPQTSFPTTRVISLLKGKWFANFRFLGYSEGRQMGVLEWTDKEASGVLQLKITPWNILIKAYNLSHHETNAAILNIQSFLFHSHIMAQFTEETTINN